MYFHHMFGFIAGTFSDEEICDLQEIAYAKPFACGPAVPLMSPYQELIKIKYH